MTPQNPLAAWKGLTFKRVHIADNVRICSQAAPRRIRGSRLSSEGEHRARDLCDCPGVPYAIPRHRILISLLLATFQYL